MKKLFPILILLIATSCDPALYNRFVIENKTGSNLKVESILNTRNRSIEQDSINIVNIESQSESLIIGFGEIGTAKDKGVYFLRGIDTIIVDKNDKTLVKNIFDRENWTFYVIKSGLFAFNEVEYKLTLTESDFE